MLTQLTDQVLRDALHDCVASTPYEQAARLRECGDLLGAPDRVAAMLDVEAYESAALCLMGDVAGWMLSRGPNGAAMASVVLAGAQEEVIAEARTPALALIAAFLAALLAAQSPVFASERKETAISNARLN